jgi:hypothetical protein
MQQVVPIGFPTPRFRDFPKLSRSFLRFADAWVSGCEHLIDSARGRLKDRHVLAAAVHWSMPVKTGSGADVYPDSIGTAAGVPWAISLSFEALFA